MMTVVVEMTVMMLMLMVMMQMIMGGNDGSDTGDE